jgi:AraC-like DNA-binding protein
MVPIADLVAATNVSHKHLVTLFNRVVGAPPKTLARLYRLEHLVAAIDTRDERTWTGVAHDFDYFDQAHFNKDFKRFTGQTPARYRELRRSAQAAHPDHASHRRLFPQG